MYKDDISNKFALDTNLILLSLSYSDSIKTKEGKLYFDTSNLSGKYELVFLGTYIGNLTASQRGIINKFIKK